MRDDMDDTFDEDDDADTPAAPERESKDLRLLRKKAKERDDAVSERDNARRELEFFKAGIPDTPQAKYFRKGYDGDLTAEAIRAAAAEVGLVEVETADDAELEEQDGLDRIAAASKGATPTSVASVTPATYADWPRDKRLAFRQRHPDLVGALERGESVKAPAAF